MPAAVRQLVLLIPGLSGPQTDHPVSDYIEKRPAALDRLLSRSRHERSRVAGLEGALCDYFDIAAGAELPAAALCWLADTGSPATQHLLCADPVHLRADQSCLRLFDAHSFSLAQEEAAALVSSINTFCAEYGWQLHAPHPQRWYLSVPQPPAMSSRSPSRVAGQDIDPFLPTGADAPWWLARMNELQMLLHDHPVNRAREQRGEPAINSLWFWGAGELPAPPRPDLQLLYCDHPLGTGLARHARVACHDVPAGATELLSGTAQGTVLVLLDSLAWPSGYNDIEAWLAALQQLEHAWFGPLLQAVQQGRVGALTIDACSGDTFHTTRGRQRAFWKAGQAFETRLHT